MQKKKQLIIVISVNCFGSHILYLTDFFHSLFFVKRGGDDCWVVPKLKWKASSSQAGSYRLTTAFKGLSTLLDLMKGVNNESVARSKSNFCMQFPLAMIAVLRRPRKQYLFITFWITTLIGRSNLAIANAAVVKMPARVFVLGFCSSQTLWSRLHQLSRWTTHSVSLHLSCQPHPIGSFLIVCEDEREAFPTPSLIYGVIVQYKSINGMRVTLNVRKILKTHISQCVLWCYSYW